VTIKKEAFVSRLHAIYESIFNYFGLLLHEKQQSSIPSLKNLPQHLDIAKKSYNPFIQGKI